MDGLDVEGMDEMSDLAGEGVGGEINVAASEAEAAAIEAEAASASSFLFIIFLLDSLAVLRSMPKISLMSPPALPFTWG